MCRYFLRNRVLLLSDKAKTEIANITTTSYFETQISGARPLVYALSISPGKQISSFRVSLSSVMHCMQRGELDRRSASSSLLAKLMPTVLSAGMPTMCDSNVRILNVYTAYCFFHPLLAAAALEAGG